MLYESLGTIKLLPNVALPSLSRTAALVAAIVKQTLSTGTRTALGFMWMPLRSRGKLATERTLLCLGSSAAHPCSSNHGPPNRGGFWLLRRRPRSPDVCLEEAWKT